ncbi:hypothetical protein BD626DRAFT_563421 [Schizophyllum amplum]|uniref:Uncharacterized protein n=1 Tax=Schizophyllum amplum TaxID=97359 RepID=A0A550CY14_9AGAR|nr:hypothetical protein BD626DRAFT_563421 [Auriculariopsis ampla]
MAPVIWGLPLSEFTFSKFGSKNMWSTDYHRRRTKVIVYQMAMVLHVVSESVGTAALSDYVDQQNGISRLNPGASEYNNDFIGVASYNIFVGIYVATIFGSGFFFDLIWPERKETLAVKRAWKICSALACVMALADAIAMTVIVATRSAYVTGADLVETVGLLAIVGGPNLIYRKNAYCLTSVILLWLGTVSTFASTYVMWKALTYIDAYGPRSKVGKTTLANGHETKTAADVEPTV